MKRILLRAAALLLTVWMLASATSCIQPYKTASSDAPRSPSPETSDTKKTPSSEAPTETVGTETAAPDGTETQTGTPTPTQTPTPTPTPVLEPSEYFGEEVGAGIRKLTLEGAEKIEDILRYGNYLITVEAGFRIDPSMEEGPVYLRSYDLSDGRRYIDYKLPTSYYGNFMLTDNGGFAHWDELGNFIHFKTPKDEEPLVFKDKGGPADELREYDFYTDGSYLCSGDNHFTFGNVFDGTSQNYTFEMPEGCDYSYVWKRDGNIVYLGFGNLEAIDGIPYVYTYDMTDGTLTKTDLMPDDRYMHGTDSFEVKIEDGAMHIFYNDESIPARDIQIYRRSEYIVNVSDDYILTSYYKDDDTIHTVYKTDGTPVFRANITSGGYLGQSIFENDGLFYSFSRYDNYECVESSVFYMDLTKTERPEPPEKNKEIENAAKAIADRYPITVLYGEDAIVDFPDFTGEVMSDEDLIIEMIEMIDRFLSSFPEGFFEEMLTDTGNDNATHLFFCLTGTLAPTTEYGISNPAAYAYLAGKEQYIVLDITQGYTLRTNLAHETMHAIDKYLDAVTDYNAYPDWYDYLPKRFEYNYGYKGDDGFDYYNDKYTPDADGEIWFIDSYSKTYPTEDRARLFENLFTGGEYSAWLDHDHVVARMKYLASVIRANFKCMENAGETTWERLLRENIEDTTEIEETTEAAETAETVETEEVA